MVPLGDRLPATTGLPTLSPIFDGGFWFLWEPNHQLAVLLFIYTHCGYR
jgi:hypothetical protein